MAAILYSPIPIPSLTVTKFVSPEFINLLTHTKWKRTNIINFATTLLAKISYY